MYTTSATAAPIDLLTAVNDALRSNPAYQATLDAYASAQQLVPIAESRYYPQLTLTGSVDYLDESVQGDYFGTRNIDLQDDFPRTAYGAFLRQAVFSGDLLFNAGKAVQQVARVKFLSDVAEDALIVGVCSAYFGLLSAQEQQRISEAKMQALKIQFEQVKGRSDAGLALEAESKSAEASLGLAAVGLEESRRAVEAAFVDLEALTGQRYEGIRPLLPSVELLPPVPADESAWITRARNNNPAILAQQMQVAVAKADVEKARYQRYPKVDVVGSYTRLDNEGGVTGKREETEGRIGLTASVPLFTGGLLTAEIARNQSEQRRAESELAAITGKAVRDTRIAYANTTLGKQKITAVQRALDAAVLAEQANKSGYEAGTRTNADVLAAVEQRYSAEFALSASRYKFLADTLYLKQVAGALLTADLSRINRLLQAGGDGR
ncbi:MAG: TolC family outer membrane protein [Pseudomonadota bacterium]